MFLKNFIFFKKKTKNDLLFINDFKIYYFYFFYNLFYLFYFFNFFFKNNTTNFFINKNNFLSNFLKTSVLEDESKKKKIFIKFFLYNKFNTIKIYNNQFNISKNDINKLIFFKKFNFNKNTYLFLKNIFFKNKLKYNKKIKFNFNIVYINTHFYNFSIRINSYFLLNFFFENYKFRKNLNFYKNIYKNFFFLKNLNQYFLNKNFFLLNNNLLDNFEVNSLFYKNINFVYNNQYPLIFFKKFNNQIFNKFNLKKKNNFLNLFNSYFLNFFEFFFKKNFFLKISNKIQLNQYKKILLFLQNYNNNIKFQKFFDSNEMIELICIVFLYKDLTLFKNWIIFILNNINIKNHKKFFVILNDFIVENFSIFSNIFNIKGFYFCVKGKIGLSGNAKKKKFFFKKGLLKISSKNFKIDNQRFYIKTNCGSLGINMVLSY